MDQFNYQSIGVDDDYDGLYEGVCTKLMNRGITAVIVIFTYEDKLLALMDVVPSALCPKNPVLADIKPVNAW